MYFTDYFYKQVNPFFMFDLDKEYPKFVNSKVCSYEEGDNLILELYAPGLDKKSIDLVIYDNKLRVKATGQDKEKGFILDKLDKELSLPERNLNVKRASAKYDAGILIITIPVDSSSRAKIKVN